MDHHFNVARMRLGFRTGTVIGIDRLVPNRRSPAMGLDRAPA